MSPYFWVDNFENDNFKVKNLVLGLGLLNYTKDKHKQPMTSSNLFHQKVVMGRALG